VTDNTEYEELADRMTTEIVFEHVLRKSLPNQSIAARHAPSDNQFACITRNMIR
jgi:hypothetical protein